LSIQPLPKEIAERIAAGEVIERPADVVKELLENSLDAGATSIVLEFTDGWQRMEGRIVVSDDGEGIEPSDLPRLFHRHSTSKIRTMEDLQRLNTLGFRGEALASMGVVAEVNITSKVSKEPLGRRISCIGGRIGDIEECGCADGTRVSVSRLFFNTPARAKFLRSELSEFRYASRILSRLAFFHLPVGFILRHKGKDLLATPQRNGDLLGRAADIWGGQLAEQLQKVNHSKGPVEISGLAALPSVFRSNTNTIFLAVNYRPIQDRSLVFTISRLYKGILPSGRYPIAGINIIVPPDFIDVNVHPRKEEVRFQKPALVKEAISEALLPLIAGSVTGVGFSPQQSPLDLSTISPRMSAVGTELKPFTHLSHKLADEALTTEKAQRDWHIVGQLERTYILVSYGGGLVIIDQHAAHERLLYNSLRVKKAGKTAHTQPLLIPRPVHLSAEEARTLEKFQNSLTEMGLEVERFGGGVWLIRTLPAGIPPQDEEGLLRDILEGLMDLGRSSRLEEAEEEILIRTACHGAVRAGEDMNPAEMEALVERIMSLPLGERRCPHGRPLVVEITAEELSKLFGRS